MRARGKVNLGLGVLGKRPDGYHEVESVAVPVGLADEIAVRPVPYGIEVRCPDVPGPPGENLAWKAGRAVLEVLPALCGLDISIIKRIPVGGGMGGASADAAAVLKAGRVLLGEPTRREALDEIARSLGADVPMFLLEDVTPEGRICAFLLQGRGDEVKPVRSREIPELYLVLVLMNFPVSTAWAYARWDEMFGGRPYRHSGKAGTSVVPGETETRPGSGYPATSKDPDGRRAACPAGFIDPRIQQIIHALKARDARLLGLSVFNDLEEPVFAGFPVIREVKQMLCRAGALGAVMTGSGSTVIGIVTDPSHGLEVCREFRRIWTKESCRGLEKSSSLTGRPGVKELVLVNRSRVLGRCKLY